MIIGVKNGVLQYWVIPGHNANFKFMGLPFDSPQQSAIFLFQVVFFHCGAKGENQVRIISRFDEKAIDFPSVYRLHD